MYCNVQYTHTQMYPHIQITTCRMTHSKHSDVYQNRVMVHSGWAKQTYTPSLAPMGEAIGPHVWLLNLTSTSLLCKHTTAAAEVYCKRLILLHLVFILWFSEQNGQSFSWNSLLQFYQLCENKLLFLSKLQHNCFAGWYLAEEDVRRIVLPCYRALQHCKKFTLQFIFYSSSLGLDHIWEISKTNMLIY